MGQLPSGAVGTAAGVLAYSVLCLLASCAMIWLTWHHRERSGYIAFLAYFTLLSTTCSVIQQTHGIVRWREIIEDQFHYMKANEGSPELIISNSAVGMDLVLYYIQFYSYNVEAFLVMFWGWTLVQSVYHLSNRPKLKQPLKLVNRAGLGFSICFPIITVSSLQAPVVRSNEQAFILLAGQPLIWSIGLGSLALLLVFIRYVYSQRKFKRSSLMKVDVSNTSSGSQSSHRQRSMYDRWLIIRFTIAFVIMAAFELAIVLFSMTSRGRISSGNVSLTPNFSVERAKRTFILYIPGVTPSLLLFVVFATTKPCIEYMKLCVLGRRSPHPITIPQRPKISPPILSPSDSTYEILKPDHSYQSVLRSDLGPYGSPRTRTFTELNDMKPLPPTPGQQGFLSSRDLESGFSSHPHAGRYYRQDMTRR
ncbi:hypothetical protein HJFPF1_02167 [Paramyrothecium foliicola]|nr:hypothetical protein HJFPF1_02167 [Paramyrothecium foliicola]